MRRHSLVIVLAGIGVLGLCASAWLTIGAHRRGGPADGSAAFGAAIAEIEAGRRTTPLIGEAAPGGESTVTFLARRAGGREPRIVSDVTGWGEHVDGTFDFAAGAMTPVGRTDWYSLRAEVAPGARIEYLVAYAPTDYRPDPTILVVRPGRKWGAHRPPSSWRPATHRHLKSRTLRSRPPGGSSRPPSRVGSSEARAA